MAHTARKPTAYLLDTNLYIRALTDRAFAPGFEAFQQAALPRLWVSAVVAFEVSVGARDTAHAAKLERWMLRPFRSRQRFLTPTDATWVLVARMDRDIRAMGGLESKLDQRSFLNDMLIAATCRQVGATLITANLDDFALINSVVALRYQGSFPAL